MKLTPSRMFAVVENDFDLGIETIIPVTRISGDEMELILDERSFSPLKRTKLLIKADEIRIHRVISKRDLLITNETALMLIKRQLLILFCMSGKNKRLFPAYIDANLVDRICSKHIRKRVRSEINRVIKSDVRISSNVV